MVEVRILEAGQESVMQNLAPDVFDYPLDPSRTVAFLLDPHHHLAVALDEQTVVGFASGFTYFHPDKPLELFINEVAVATAYQRQGIAKQLLQLLFAHAKALGCTQAWVLTENTNVAARKLYKSLEGKLAQPVLYSFDLEA